MPGNSTSSRPRPCGGGQAGSSRTADGAAGRCRLRQGQVVEYREAAGERGNIGQHGIEKRFLDNVQHVQAGDKIVRPRRPCRERWHGGIVAGDGGEQAERADLLDEAALAAAIVQPAQFGGRRSLQPPGQTADGVVQIKMAVPAVAVGPGVGLTLPPEMGGGIGPRRLCHRPWLRAGRCMALDLGKEKGRRKRRRPV